MLNQMSRARVCGLFVVLSPYVFHGEVSAGLPEPGLLLYGQIRDGTGALATTGEVTWTWSRVDGEGAVTMSTPLDAHTIDGTVYSYRMVVPFEAEALGVPGSSGALDVTNEHVVYARTAIVAPLGLSYEDRVTVSAFKRAGWERIDIVPDNAFHSMDGNEDGRFELGDILEIIELYAGYPEQPNLFHEYHCAPGGGYAPGPGPRNCMRHAGDYRLESEASLPGVPYEFDLLELLRLIELYQADLNQHTYRRDWGNGEDGFQGGSAQVVGLKSQRGSADVSMTRELRPVVTDTGVYLDVTVRIANAGDASPTALGLIEFLPVGWEFEAMIDGAPPIMTPHAGQGQFLEFAWLGSAPENASITYTLAVPDAISLLDRIDGEVVYRDGSGAAPTMKAVQGGGNLPFDVDRDGDGIIDLVEILDLYDEAQGASPGQLMAALTSTGGDRDGDGVPDVVESVELYGDAGIDTLLPALSPGLVAADSDGDGVPNHLDTDSDNDGNPDRTEVNLGTNPVSFVNSPALPVHAGGLLVLLGVAGAWCVRRRKIG